MVLRDNTNQTSPKLRHWPSGIALYYQGLETCKGTDFCFDVFQRAISAKIGRGKAPYDSKVVALGDKLSNMRGIAWDYRKVGDEVWKLFHAPKGKDDIAWYYHSLAKALSALSGTAAYQEFVNLVDEVF